MHRVVVIGAGVGADHAGRVPVLPDLTLPGHPEVFVIGDLMPASGFAQVAIQSGRFAARQITQRLAGKPTDEADNPSLLEIGRRAAMQAERAAIEKTLAQTRWNRRQAAQILKISYKALLNKLKTYEEHDAAHEKNLTA